MLGCRPAGTIAGSKRRAGKVVKKTNMQRTKRIERTADAV
jgi:hypothetical protein